MAQNWFEKNPGKTLTAIIAVLFILLVFGAEQYLSRNKSISVKGIGRHILLKEHRPLFYQVFTPAEKQIENSDGLTPKSFQAKIDSHGFIYPSKIHNNPDATIVFLGGSTTETLYVEEENRFPYRVGRLLEDGTRKVNSYNSGVGGNNSLHSINILLHKIIPLQPEMVVMMHNINDLNILLLEGDYWNQNPYKGPIQYETPDTPLLNIQNGLSGIKDMLFPKLYSRINAVVRRFKPEKQPDEFARIRGKKLQINEPHLLEKFKTNLEMFIVLCRSNKLVPVLMTQANRFKAEPDDFLKKSWTLERDFGIQYTQYKHIYDAFNEAIRTVGKTSNTLVVDLDRKVPRENAYMFDTVHFNDNGSKFVAEIIANDLRTHLFKSPLAQSARERSSR